MNLIETEILESREVAPGYFLHAYESPLVASEANPGQFVHVRVASGPHPILRRPFSVSFAEKDRFEILFKVVGEGTRILSEAKKGQKIDILGPVGNPFMIVDKPAVVIAGGIGCAPLYFLARRAKDKNLPVFFYYGARTRNDLALLDEIAHFSDSLKIATEDGSAGEKGFITDVLPERLANDRAIYACGPEPMLYALKNILDARGLSAQFSLENRMACGVGACMGCVTKTRFGFKRVCVDGPVFSSDDLIAKAAATIS